MEYMVGYNSRLERLVLGKGTSAKEYFPEQHFDVESLDLKMYETNVQEKTLLNGNKVNIGSQSKSGELRVSMILNSQTDGDNDVADLLEYITTGGNGESTEVFYIVEMCPTGTAPKLVIHPKATYEEVDDTWTVETRSSIALTGNISINGNGKITVEFTIYTDEITVERV